MRIDVSKSDRERFLFNFCTVKYIYKALENEDIGRYKKRWNKKGASKSIGEVTVLPIAPLTTEEEGARLHLERKVERAFYEAGMALMQLRDRRLYRTTHPTFEDYCRDLRSIAEGIASIMSVVAPIN